MADSETYPPTRTDIEHIVVARRGNEGIFRDMVARPAPNFPDALARNPQPLAGVGYISG